MLVTLGIPLFSFLQRIVSILLLTALANQALADDEPVREAPAKQDSPQVETVWIEEKIAPPTRWLEGLVKPMTSWMEGKIQKRQNDSQAPALVQTPKQTPTREDTEMIEGELIDPQQIALIAREAVPGQILRIKLLSRRPPQYRVKLISTTGEIRILYINAVSGEILKGANKAKGT